MIVTHVRLLVLSHWFIASLPHLLSYLCYESKIPSIKAISEDYGSHLSNILLHGIAMHFHLAFSLVKSHSNSTLNAVVN